MIKQKVLILAAGAFLFGSPILPSFAQEEAPPAAVPTPAAAEPKKEEKPAKPSDPEKAKFNAARKQALEDPDVKASMEAAQKAKREADLKMFEKMRVIDPSLGPVLDKEEAKLKAREPKAAADKPAKDKVAAKPAKDKAPEDAKPDASPTP